MQDDDQESMVMPNKKGEKFLCFLPKVEQSKGRMLVAEQNISSMIVESEEHFQLKTPDELLEVLKGRCFIRVMILNHQNKETGKTLKQTRPPYIL